jgi:phage terminase small subunit
MTTRHGSTLQGLSPKHRAFVDEYMKDRNAIQAAIRAGYSRRTAKQIGFRMLTKVDVAEEVGRRIEEYTRIAGIETLKILEFLRDALLADPTKILTGSRVMNPSALSEDVKKLVTEPISGPDRYLR